MNNESQDVFRMTIGTDAPRRSEAAINVDLTNVQNRQRELADEVVVVQRRYSEAQKIQKWTKAKHAFLTGAARLRAIAEKLIGWRLGMVVIYAALALILSFFCEIVLGFGPPMLLVALLAVVAVAVFHYFPNDARLATELRQSDDERARLAMEIAEHQDRLDALRHQQDKIYSLVTALQGEARRANKQWQTQQERLALLQMPWKSYRSVEFEQFLVQVFAALGCSAETTKVTGDQGADLLVTIGQQRTAVQVKGYVSSVSNGAVQEAYSAMKFYNCHGCMVITNSLFTASATQLAEATGCVLIDETRLPDMIIGKLDLARLWMPVRPGVPVAN